MDQVFPDAVRAASCTFRQRRAALISHPRSCVCLRIFEPTFVVRRNYRARIPRDRMSVPAKQLSPGPRKLFCETVIARARFDGGREHPGKTTVEMSGGDGGIRYVIIHSCVCE